MYIYYNTYIKYIMINLTTSPNRYTSSWPPTSNSTSNFTTGNFKRKPHFNRGSIPSGIQYKEQTPAIDTNSISRVYDSCDCKKLQTQIKKLKDENLTLNEMLESHMTLLKNTKGGSKRSRKSSTSMRKYKHKYRNTRVRR